MTTPRDPSPAPRRLGWLQRFTYAVGNLPVIVPYAVLGQWLVYFYAGSEESGRPTYATVSVISGLGFLGAVANSLFNPIVGYVSDRGVTRFGRRLPWLAIAGPLLAVVFTLVWFPPDESETLGNTLYAAFLVISFYVLYVAYTAPYLALLPEIVVKERERVVLSMMQGIFEVLGTLFAMAAVPTIISAFEGEGGEPAGLKLGPVSLANGYEVMGVLVGGVVLVSALLQLINIRERAPAELARVTMSFRRSVVETFRNPAFLPYVLSQSFYRLCLMMILIVSPFLVTKVIGGREEDLAPLMGAIIVGSALLFPLTVRLTSRIGMRRLFLWALFGFAVLLPLVVFVGDLPGIGRRPFIGTLLAPLIDAIAGSGSPSSEMIHATVVFILLAAPVSVFMVLPHALMAEIIDEDERRTGYRREAIYNGVEGLLTTMGWGVAFLVNGALLAIWDVKEGETLGVLCAFPAASAIMFVAWAIFRRYPLGRASEAGANE